MWAGRELEAHTGEIEGLILADHMSADELARLGVTEFHRIPSTYIEADDFKPKASSRT